MSEPKVVCYNLASQLWWYIYMYSVCTFDYTYMYNVCECTSSIT